MKIVYIRDSGTHYHVKPCRFIDERYTEVSLKLARERFYKPCLCYYAMKDRSNAHVFMIVNYNNLWRD